MQLPITKMTRRRLAGAMMAAAAAAQTPTAPSGPADELQKARDQNLHTRETLAKVEVPMEMEPAFQFKA